MSQIVEWLIINEQYILNEIEFPLQVDAKSSLEFFDKSGTFDSDDIEEFHKWYTKRQDWYFRHSWYFNRGGLCMAEFTYDCRNRLVKVKEEDERVTLYEYEKNVFGAYTEPVSSTTYTYGLGLVSERRDTGEQYYYHYNYLGSAMAVSDGSGEIGNSQSLNRFCYVQGNSVSLTDPFGLYPDGNGVAEGFKQQEASTIGLIGGHRRRRKHTRTER